MHQLRKNANEPTKPPLSLKHWVRKSWKDPVWETKFPNTKSDIDRKLHNKQCKNVVSLLRKEKQNFYENLDISRWQITEFFGKW